jgi:hypothetical protein
LKKRAEEKMDVFYRKALRDLAAINIPEEKKSVLYDFARQLMERES